MLTAMAAAVMALSTVVAPAEAADSPPDDRITVTVVTVNGSGCPAGTAAVAAAADNTAFTVTYSDFLAQIGVGASPTDFRKNCQLSLRVNYPQGFTYGIAQADYRGFAHLVAGAKGTEKANYYFSGSPSTGATHPFSGPLSDYWQATDKTEVAQIVYAPCGEQRIFNVNTELRVSAGTSDISKTTSFMAMDSTDGSVKTTFHFSWKRCP
ncbi:DUF4360 domain-containing protein [Umezawaea endophytica]|uniref:DUF4360 domain-containing protein n=1 Tax=Umezawaea endophytica TaxID=1654476 RepID=A0A9X3A2V8_9PSEU|nr:DUF4360 domain-containing protein [Umezawaea endophytica]MCS7481049.1 DUF4360 domain-containing protein [Umezawaea endophytica]